MPTYLSFQIKVSRETKKHFYKNFFENILKGFKATDLTIDSIIIALQELVLYANKNILVSIENQEELLIFTTKDKSTIALFILIFLKVHLTTVFQVLKKKTFDTKKKAN